jgi:GT2 family glycosyltransferase
MPEKSSLNDRSPAALKCSVIIVSFNQFESLKAAIGSLKKDPPPFDHEIIVVDNHSSDDVQEFLNDYFHDIRIIRNPSNQGFGWANNRGVQAARGEYLLFLNSDAEITGAALARLVGVMDRDAAIGILGPMLRNTDGSFQLSFGKKISLCAELYQKTMAPAWEKWKLNFHDREKYLKNVDWVSGACLLTRRELFLSGLVFDEEMFLYFEDHDLCLRVKAMGKKVTYCPGAEVRHHGGRSVPGLPSTMFEYRRSQLYLYRKHLKRWQSFLLRRYLACKFSRQLRRARDENGKQIAVRVLELLKEK